MGIIGQSDKKQIENNSINNGEAVSEMVLLNLKKQSEQNVLIGQYNVKWKRYERRFIIALKKG